MSNWFERKIGRQIDWKLASLQIGSVIAAACLLVALIALYHHWSEDWIIDFDKYLWSFKIVIPPTAIFISTYAIAFVAGISLSEAPKAAIKFLRNRFFQEPLWMAPFVVSSVLFSLWVTHHVTTNPPQDYETLVAQLMGGESDDHAVVSEKLKSLKTANSEHTRRIESVIAVFKERRRLNLENKAPSVALSRIFVRTLDANVQDEQWREHPLRKHGLAEAYSMWMQAAQFVSRQIEVGHEAGRDWERYGKKAIELYEEVAKSESRFATQLMRVSAENNIGNVYYYSGQFESAIKVYLRLLDRNFNLSSAGNLFASYIKIGQPEKVLSLSGQVIKQAFESDKARLEPSTYAGVVDAIGFAYLLTGNLVEAIPRFRETHEVMNDVLSKQNLAVVYALNGNREAARHLISTIGFEPVTSENLNARLVSGKSLGCSAFIWGIVEDDNPVVSAPYFYGYLGKAQSVAMLRKVSVQDLNALKKDVAVALQKDSPPCSDLFLVPLLKKRLGVS